MNKLLVILSLLLFAACGGNKSGNASSEGSAASVEQKKFIMPKIPTMLVTEQERMEFLAGHYWDNFDFSDTTYINIPEVTEQAFADYVNVLNYMPINLIESSINSTFAKAGVEKKMLDYFVELSEKYLYDPNSPMRNEDIYIIVLENIIASDSFSDIEKLRPQSQLNMALKNRMGHKANDLTYTTANGSNGSLYNINAEFTLLYINNPDCNACAAITAAIVNSPMLSDLILSGRMKVLALYPDEDLKAWRDHQKDMPSNWINAYDKDLKLRNEDIYDLRAIPTLYLMDRDKKLLLKDVADVRILERYFASILN